MKDKKFDLEDRFVELAANIAIFCKDLEILRDNIMVTNCSAQGTAKL